MGYAELTNALKTGLEIVYTCFTFEYSFPVLLIKVAVMLKRYNIKGRDDSMVRTYKRTHLKI
jgi:hypothetical protein